MEHRVCQARYNQRQSIIGPANRLCCLTCRVQHHRPMHTRPDPAIISPRNAPAPTRTPAPGWKQRSGINSARCPCVVAMGRRPHGTPMAHSPHANILEHARLSLAPGHVARRADAYLIALASRYATMTTWENHVNDTPHTPHRYGLLSFRCLPIAPLLVSPRCIAAQSPQHHPSLVGAMMMIFIRSNPLSDG